MINMANSQCGPLFHIKFHKIWLKIYDIKEKAN